jgi:hypothetical protein
VPKSGDVNAEIEGRGADESGMCEAKRRCVRRCLSPAAMPTRSETRAGSTPRQE